MQRKVLVAVLAAASVASVSACSSSGHPTKSAPTPTKSISSSSSAPAPTPSGSETITAADLTTLLLAPSDIGIADATSAPSSSTDNPLPCAASATSPSLNQQVPATVRSGVDLTSASLQVELGEEIRLYKDVATAGSAFAAVKAGLNCTSGTLRADDGTGTPATIHAGQDITSDLATDQKLSTAPIAGEVWQTTAAGADIALVAVQIDRSLVLFTFQNVTGADTSKLPSPPALISAGLEKIESN
jgi:hypothetical protein